MFLKQPKIRQFEYSPRFYKPESGDEDDKRRIKFRRLTERKSVPKRSVWGLLLMILVLIFLIRYLFSVIKSDKQEFEFEELKIETIE